MRVASNANVPEVSSAVTVFLIVTSTVFFVFSKVTTSPASAAATDATVHVLPLVAGTIAVLPFSTQYSVSNAVLSSSDSISLTERDAPTGTLNTALPTTVLLLSTLSVSILLIAVPFRV